MLDNELLPATYEALADTLGVEVPAVAEGARLDAVRRFLIGEITRLLDQKPEFLMHILYRIDVDERKVKHVFAHSPAETLAADLADLMIARQLQKLDIRRRYGSS